MSSQIAISTFLFRLDYCGIAFLEMGSFVPYLYYSFYCRLGVKITYVACIICLGTLCLVVSLWDKFSEPRFRALRAGNCISLLKLICCHELFKSSIPQALLNEALNIFTCNCSCILAQIKEVPQERSCVLSYIV